MARPSIYRPRPRLEYDFPGHRFMCHFAIEWRKSLKVVARQPPRLRAKSGVEIAGVVELHLRQQHGVASPYGKRIGPWRRTMQNQRADAGELLQDFGMPRLVVGPESLRTGRRAA